MSKKFFLDSFLVWPFPTIVDNRPDSVGEVRTSGPIWFKSRQQRSPCCKTMRWWNNREDRSPDAGNTPSCQSSKCHGDEGKRRFSLFRGRCSDLNLDLDNKENERSELLSSESDQDSAFANTTVPAVAAVDGLSTSLLDCSNEEISDGGVDEGIIDDDQSTDRKEIDSSAKFNWFGLLKNNQTVSPCEENKRSCEYTSLDNQTNVVVECDEESLNGIEDDTVDVAVDNTEADRGGFQYDRSGGRKPRFNWFGLLQPSQNASSCLENDVSELHTAALQKIEDEEGSVRRDEEVEEKEEDDDNNDEGSQYSFDRESSAEMSTDENPADDSMDTHDIVLDISDDERLQALVNKCSAQRSDQQDEHRHSYGEDDEHCDASSHIMNDDNEESEFFVNRETPLGEEILALWQRRKRLKRKLQIDGPILNRGEMIGTSQIEVGGGRNEENLRSLELESHLIETNKTRKMARMEIMMADEKEREDLLYDMWLQDLCEMAGEEPEYGQDKRGWYSTLTQREDGEADLEYRNSSAMVVATEDDDESVNKSNRWLDGVGNAALFVFAPELYFMQQVNEFENQSGPEPKYHVTSSKEEGEQDTEQTQGWFKKMFTSEGRRRDQ